MARGKYLSLEEAGTTTSSAHECEVDVLHIVGVGVNRIGMVESLLLQAQPNGTIVAQNMSVPTSSTPSAITGHPRFELEL